MATVRAGRVAGGGGGSLYFTVTAVGWEDFARALDKHFTGRKSPRKKRDIFLRMMHVASKPMVTAAKVNYKVGGSDSLSVATRAYRWKAQGAAVGGANLRGYQIRVGPKRSIGVALNRWIAHYRRKVKTSTFVYGIRHAHLYEFGFQNRFMKRKWPGTKALTRAGQVTKGPTVREMRRIFRNVVNKQLERDMRRRTRTRIVR